MDKLKKPDQWLIFLTIILIIIGLTFVTDASAVTIVSLKYDRALKQLLFAIMGSFICFIISRLSLKRIKSLTASVSIIILILLLYVVIDTQAIKGAHRWINIFGITIQPSEFAKIAIILISAWLITESRMFHNPIWRSDHPHPQRKLWITLFIISILMILLVASENMSGGIILSAAFICTLYFGGLSTSIVVGISATAVAAGSLFLAMGEGFRQSRIDAYHNPIEYMNDVGMQIVYSLTTISAAGWFGVGFGNGTVKNVIPEPDNDYIFATIIEETGFIGGAILLTLYVMLIWHSIRIAKSCKNTYGKNLAFGCAIIFAIQIFINTAVALNVIPVTGVCLPFISYGGSSLICSFILIGILLSVSRQIKITDDELSPRRKRRREQKTNTYKRKV